MKENTVLVTLAKPFLWEIALLPFLLSSQKALADERWTTEQYDVVYEADRNRTAIWSYGDNGGTIFIDGLAGVYEGRESYSGYWVQDTSSLRCDTYREGADGTPTYSWEASRSPFSIQDFLPAGRQRLGDATGNQLSRSSALQLVATRLELISDRSQFKTLHRSEGSTNSLRSNVNLKISEKFD